MSDSITFIAHIDAAELACRIVEAFGGVFRPPDATAREALALADPAFRAPAIVLRKLPWDM